MFASKVLRRSPVLVLLAFLLVMSRSPSPAAAMAPPPAAFTYQGYVTDGAGKPLSGNHGFWFQLWDAQTGGNQVGSYVDAGPVAVEDGVLSVAIDVPPETFDGRALWLQLGVDGTWLPERQPILGTPMAHTLRPGAMVGGEQEQAGILNLANWSEGTSAFGLYAAAGGPLRDIPLGRHGVLGIGESSGVTGIGSNVGVAGTAAGPDGAGGMFNGHTGVIANGSGGVGVVATSDEAFAVHATSDASWAIVGSSGGGVAPEVVTGYRGVSGYGNNYGVYGDGNEAGVVGVSGPGVGVLARGGGQARYNAALRAENTNPSQGMAAYLENESDFATAHVRNQGTGEVLLLESAGGRILSAMGPGWDAKFRLEANGEAYADGSWHAGGADFAEMLPGVPGLDAGDVLVIGADGRLTRSSSASQANVAGVLSERPGFVAGQPIEGGAESLVPLAVVGVVPVRACAENGPIVPGDLLVAASTPGRAMRAGQAPATGTVIGKALEPLATGAALIRMLVTLQ